MEGWSITRNAIKNLTTCAKGHKHEALPSVLGRKLKFNTSQGHKSRSNIPTCIHLTEANETHYHEIDNLHWFSQHRSEMPHFWGCTPRGLWPPNSNSAEIFVQCTYPFESYRVDKHTNTPNHPQTNRCRWKHPPLFAMLRCLVKIASTASSFQVISNVLIQKYDNSFQGQESRTNVTKT